jgi:DedD protein
MAFFKFRFPGRADGQTAQAVQSPGESVESLRRRARHRLIGAAVLLLIGVVGFPLLFDTQPRPVAVDIPIEIPDKTRTKPLTMPAAAATSQPVATAPAVTPAVTQAGPVTEPVKPAPAVPVARAEPKEEIITEMKEPKPVAKPVAKAEPKPEPKPAAAVASKSADDGNRARALLEGKAAPAADKAAETGRFVVQVGAFADAGKAREARMVVERAGLKTYTQVAETADGKRTRVRVGPFSTRAEADKAASKIKGLDLPAAILTL